MDNFDLRKYLTENKLHEEENTFSRKKIFDDFKQMAKDLSDKTGAKVKHVTFPSQFRFVVDDTPYFGWWGGAMRDITIKNINPSEEQAKRAYDSAEDFINTFSEKYEDYKSFINKGEKAFKQEVERRRKEHLGNAFKPIRGWDMDDNPYYANFFPKS